MISPVVFELSIIVGGALLALWVVVRFPDLGPSRLWTALGQIVIAYFVGSELLKFAPVFLSGLVPRDAVSVALVAGTLPPVVYLFTTVAWLIRNLQRLVSAYR